MKLLTMQPIILPSEGNSRIIHLTLLRMSTQHLQNTLNKRKNLQYRPAYTRWCSRWQDRSSEVQLLCNELGLRGYFVAGFCWDIKKFLVGFSGSLIVIKVGVES